MTEKEKVLSKLAKLRAHMESAKALGSEQEAEAFAGMFNRLLMEHELEASDVDYAERSREEPIVERRVRFVGVEKEPAGATAAGRRKFRFWLREGGVRIGGPFDSHRAATKAVYDLGAIERKKTRQAWQETLAGIVAPAHMCKFLIAEGSNAVWFVGTTTHAECAEFAYVTLVRVADSMSTHAYEQYCRSLVREAKSLGVAPNAHVKAAQGYRPAWLNAFIERIAERYREERAALEAEARRAQVADERGWTPAMREAVANLEKAATSSGIALTNEERLDVAARASATAATSSALVRIDQALVRAKRYVDEKYSAKRKAIAALDLPLRGNAAGRRDGRTAANGLNIGGARRALTKGGVG